MVLKKLSGNKVSVDSQVLQSSIDAPSIAVYGPGRAFLKVMAMRLLGITALTDPAQVALVRTAAAALSDLDDVQWTAAETQRLLDAVGTVPAPSHVRIQRLIGQGIVLLRAATPETPRARLLRYAARTHRASVTLLSALRPEGILIPKASCMDVPVKIVEDDEGLALAAYFRRGKLRGVADEAEGQGAGTSKTASSR